MITGELKNKINGIWDIFWSSGMTNPLTVIEQITYLMFIKILDDNELRKEANTVAQYVSEKYQNELMKTENMKHYTTTMFTGFDTDQTMLRIGAMNMILHGVGAPHITWMDSLSDDNTHRGEFSLIMTNPPFTGSLDLETISKDLLAVAKTKKTELLFINLFTKMLKTGGRCASVVPDGVLFGSSNAHKVIRKEIVENHRLEAIINMPSGVHKPYTGVSTAIIIFTKTGAGGTEDVWFYDMKSDGYSLDDKRTDLGQSDIPDIVARFHNLNGEKSRERTEQSFLVPKREIADNDYDLSINKYKKTLSQKVEYPPTSEIMAELIAMDAKITAGLKELEGLLDE